ncbi:MAG: RHS repeat-associated core domain-containing protein [Bacteroidota bacterium]
MCSGDEYHVVREELSAIPGNYLFLQEFTVLSATEPFPMEVESGAGTVTVMGNMQDFLDHRSGNSGTPLFAVNGYVPCGELSPCHPRGELNCTPEERALQETALAQLNIVMQNTQPSNINLPNTLYRVEFCNGSSLYLLPEEIAAVNLGPHAIIHAIPISDLNETFEVIVDGVTPPVSTSLYGIFTQRINHDILILGYGCSVLDFPNENANGLYEVTGENFQYQVGNNSDIVTITFDKVVKLDGNEILREPQTVTTVAGYNLAPRAYTLDPAGYISEIFVSTLNPTSSFPVYFRPTDVQQHYPGLVASNPGILTSLQSFGATAQANDKYASALQDVVNYAVELNGPGPSQNLIAVEANTPVADILFKFQVIHNPSGYYANCDHSVFYISCSKDGTGTENCNSKLGYMGQGKFEWTISHDPCGFIYATFYEWDLVQYSIQDWYMLNLTSPPPNFTYGNNSITCTEITTPEIYCGPPIAIFDDCQYYTCGGFDVVLPELPSDCCDGTFPNGGGGTTTPSNPNPFGGNNGPEAPDLSDAMQNKSPANTPFPNHLNRVQLENGWQLYVLDEELNEVPDDCFDGVSVINVESDSTPLHLTLRLGDQWVQAGNVTLAEVMEYRAQDMAMIVEEGNPNAPQLGLEPLTPFVTVPEFSFFIYDHLGNTRVLYSNDLIECDEDSTKYILEHVNDYYPFGRKLREYVYVRERFQTTYHERDLESGLDYRGARFYDGDIGRFLSNDPLAHSYYAWSPYNYVLGNPIKNIDPDGRSVETDFVNTATGEHIHINDGVDQIVLANNEDWGFIKQMSTAETWNAGQTYQYDEIVAGGVLDMNSDLGKLTRIAFAEFEGEGVKAMMVAAESVLNRIDYNGDYVKYSADLDVSTVDEAITAPGAYAQSPGKQQYTDPYGYLNGGGGFGAEYRDKVVRGKLANAAYKVQSDPSSRTGAHYYVSPPRTVNSIKGLNAYKAGDLQILNLNIKGISGAGKLTK